VLSTRDPAAYSLPDLAAALQFGVSPRATLGLVAAARALALMRGRSYVLPGDLADVAEDVIAHRLVMTFDALADGVDPRHLVRRVLDAVRQPVVAPAQEGAAA
jgi:MoxR-like ATPase